MSDAATQRVATREPAATRWTVAVRCGLGDTWWVMCGCGYAAPGIADRMRAHLVAATHWVATGHPPV